MVRAAVSGLMAAVLLFGSVQADCPEYHYEVCEDDDGTTATNTYTYYPSGCPTPTGYVDNENQWAAWTTAAAASPTWNPAAVSSSWAEWSTANPTTPSSSWAAWSTADPATSTWSDWSSANPASTNTWSDWSSANPASTSTWAAWSSANPASTNTWSAWTTANPATTSTWAAWSTASPVSSSAVGAQQASTWATWSSAASAVSPWNTQSATTAGPIATYTNWNAGSRVGGESAVLIAAGAMMGMLAL